MIINVGRQLGSGGRVIARQLADNLGCRFFDRELLNLAAKESGFCESVFEQNDENKRFFKSLFHLHVPYLSDGNFYSNKLSQESLFKFQSDAIRRAADEGPCVFVGRCADYVFRERPDAVNIFITADMKDRIRMVCGREKCSEEKAMKIINAGDRERAAYYNYYTGKVWGHGESYDLCINSSLMGLERTEEFVRAFVCRRLGILQQAPDDPAGTTAQTDEEDRNNK